MLALYVHARIMLSRLRYLVEEHGDDTLTFANRGGSEQSVNLRELADRLVNGVGFGEDNAEWLDAKRTFLNPTGWLDGGSSYCILESVSKTPKS